MFAVRSIVKWECPDSFSRAHTICAMKCTAAYSYRMAVLRKSAMKNMNLNLSVNKT